MNMQALNKRNTRLKKVTKNETTVASFLYSLEKMRSLLLVNFFFIAAYAFVYQEGGGVNRISRSNSQRLASSVEQTSIATPKLNYDLELWRKGFTDCKNEVCEYLNGSLPLDLVGTYYR